MPQTYHFDAVSQPQVEGVLNKVLSVYRFEISQLKAPLKSLYEHDKFQRDFGASSAEMTIKESWDDLSGSWKPYYLLHLTGVFTRIDGMNTDGVALLVCHELGHILGGAPMFNPDYTGFGSPPNFNQPMSVEGQADYFAAAKCFKRYARATPSIDKMVSDPTVKNECAKASNLESEREICERTAMAGLTLLNGLVNTRRYSGQTVTSPAFGASVSSKLAVKLGRTIEDHPDYQCRLETYLAGALCNVSPDLPVSWFSFEQGYCHDGIFGARPGCWFSSQQYWHL